MTKLGDLKKEALQNPEVRREYDELEEEFAVRRRAIARVPRLRREKVAMFDISTSRDFYAKLLADFDDFMENADSARHAMNCAITAHHVHDWVWSGQQRRWISHGKEPVYIWRYQLKRLDIQ